MTSRRTVLATLGVGALTLLLPRKSRAAQFGTFPEMDAAIFPEGRRVQNVLEVFLYGGLSPWETFYFVPDRGKADKRFYYAFEGRENSEALTACGSQEASTQLFARDQRGVDVHLGPFARALFARPDLIDRMRIVVQKHNLLPHEAAVPYGITGKFVGAPSLSSLGAHVQRAFFERARRDVPYAFVLMNGGGAPSDNIDAFMATGSHPGSARPLRLNVDDAARLETLLARPSVDVAHRAAYDAYLDAMVRSYDGRLRHRNQGEPLRSKAVRELAASVRAVAGTESIARMLPKELLTAPEASLCRERERNYSLASLRLATHLLKHPENPARYVCVLDSGLVTASGGGGYDTHGSGEQIIQLTNLENLLTSLSSIINARGERDPNKLDLDQTLVILNTEFGRTPGLQADSGGRNHHPNGYVTVFLGGPVQGRSIQGAIDDQGEGIEAATPAENRIAALLAARRLPVFVRRFLAGGSAGSEHRVPGYGARAVTRARRQFRMRGRPWIAIL